VVRETSYAIHCYHRNGHLEKVYENALVHRLRKQGRAGRSSRWPLTVHDEDGTVLERVLRGPVLVEGCLVVELKACQGDVAEEHMSPSLLGYLKSSCIRTGLLVNFGESPVVREEVPHGLIIVLVVFFVAIS
jgi:GxxExxY protein